MLKFFSGLFVGTVVGSAITVGLAARSKPVQMAISDWAYFKTQEMLYKKDGPITAEDRRRRIANWRR